MVESKKVIRDILSIKNKKRTTINFLYIENIYKNCVEF